VIEDDNCTSKLGEWSQSFPKKLQTIPGLILIEILGCHSFGETIIDH
jgi:hypothetical protein